MRQLLIPATLLTAVLGTPACAQQANGQPEDDTIIATINGQPYTLDLFRGFYGERMQETGGQDSPQLQEQVFNEFLNLVVAAQEGEARDLEQSEAVQTALELQRMMVLSNAALQVLAGEADPSEDELKAAYDRFVAQSQRTEYKARHILVDDKDKAQELIAELDANGGEGFEALAEEHSLGPTAESGGDLGWFDSRRMVKPFADAVAEMEAGRYSKQPVQTQFGWHVILLEDTRAAEPPSFEEAKPQIEAQVRRQKVAEALAEMRREATVELNEDVVKLKAEPEAGEGEG